MSDHHFEGFLLVSEIFLQTQDSVSGQATSTIAEGWQYPEFDVDKIRCSRLYPDVSEDRSARTHQSEQNLE